MARRVTRATQRDPINTPFQCSKVISSSIPPEPNKNRSVKRNAAKNLEPTNLSSSAAPVAPPSSPVEPSPSFSPDGIEILNSIDSLPISSSPHLAPTTSPSTSTLHVSTTESTIANTRRTALQTLQATRYPHLAGTSEPNLNDPNEVRHFEVDSQGSLTFLLLDGGEAWRLREVGVDSTEKGQMIVGRFYVVERV